MSGCAVLVFINDAVSHIPYPDFYYSRSLALAQTAAHFRDWVYCKTGVTVALVQRFMSSSV